jgi:DNA-binding transcriptional MerR regulator
MAKMNSRAELTTGQLGAATGVSADTIRHYEKLGLLKKAIRSDGGYRLYDPSTITRVRTIRSAVKAGFSLVELSGIFRERDAGGAPCQRVAALATKKVESLEGQIHELIELKDWLASTVKGWHKRLEHTPAGKRAGLLDSLREEPSEHPNQQPKGITNENARSHLRSMSRLRGKGPNDYGMPDARSASKVR